MAIEIDLTVSKINKVEASVAPDGCSLLPGGSSSHGTAPKGENLGCLQFGAINL